MNILKYLQHAQLIIETTALPLLTAGFAKFQQNSIQTINALDESLTKEKIKHNLSISSGIVNAGMIATSTYLFIKTLFETGKWYQLTLNQRLAITANLIVATLGTSYSMITFGEEQHTLMAGLSAAASVLVFNMGKNLTAFFHHKNNPKDAADTLFSIDVLDECYTKNSIDRPPSTDRLPSSLSLSRVPSKDSSDDESYAKKTSTLKLPNIYERPDGSMVNTPRPEVNTQDEHSGLLEIPSQHYYSTL